MRVLLPIRALSVMRMAQYATTTTRLFSAKPTGASLIPPNLKNRFYGMRHGNSEANQEGLISSNPEVATLKHGLSSLGVEQVVNSVEGFMGREGADRRTVKVFCSDFKRAAMTADMLAAGTGTVARRDIRIRERWFGELDNGPDDKYDDVWVRDEKDADQEWKEVESVNKVRERASDLVREIEAETRIGEEGDIVLVAHGDVLQILMTAFDGVRGEDHRSLKHLETAEIRELGC
jgi:probable phosphoglycerate mutase